MDTYAITVFLLLLPAHLQKRIAVVGIEYGQEAESIQKQRGRTRTYLSSTYT